MRALLAILVTGLLAAPAAADPPTPPPAPPPAKKKPPARAAVKKKPAAPAPVAAPGISLGSMAAAATAKDRADAADARTPNGARRLDLTPARLFGVKGPKADRRGAERGSGVSLGDDTSWGVQAAQVGVMAAGFAALWALCGGGNCMLPDVLPDAFTVEEGLPADVEIRLEPQVRSAR